MSIAEDPFARFSTQERARILRECSRRMTIDQRVLLHQHYVLEMSLRRVAQMFQVSASTMTYRHHRALQHFRAELARRKIRCLMDLDPR